MVEDEVMNALKQYIELFAGHSELVCGKSSPVMNTFRQEALEVLSKTELPKKGAENYEKTDLSAMLAPDYGLNLSRVPIDINIASAFRCGVPSLSNTHYMLLNDSYHKVSNGEEDLPEGVIIGSLREFSMENPKLAEKYYGKLANIENPVVALNTLFAQDGIVVYVPKGVEVQKPVQIVNILNNGMPLMAVRRLLVILEEGARVKILVCDHTQNPEVQFMDLQTVELYAAKNSNLDFYELEESTPMTNRLSAMYLEQEEGSSVLIDGITLYNGTTRNEYYCKLKEERCELKLMGMGIEDKNRHLDSYSRIEHLAKNCHCDELFKYVVDDEAAGAFSGLIKVMQGASGTEAYQTNRNIIGSDKADMFSKPQLEIYEDDVKCSHGSATGQLDAMQIFYMQTRGIPEEEAKLLLKQAFMADVIEGVKMEGLKERLHLLVERRFSGNQDNNCSTCRLQ